MSDKKGSNAEDIHDATPPLHSIALVGCLTAILIPFLPSFESLDEVATTQTFTRVLFPNVISVKTMGWIRIMFGATLCTTLFLAFLLAEQNIQTNYKPGSKLKSVEISFRGYLHESSSFGDAILTQAPFTQWSVHLFAWSNLLSGIISLLVAHGYDQTLEELSPWILRVAILLFEIGGPNVMLVSIAVRYAIWPMNLSNGISTAPFKHPRVLINHNATSIMALIEVALLGGLPVRLSHFPIAPIFGLLYVVFTWFMMHRWTSRRDYGAQFIYWFMDTTLGGTSSVLILGLFIVLVMTYLLFAGIDHIILNQMGGGLLVHSLAVVGISSLVCRFRD